MVIECGWCETRFVLAETEHPPGPNEYQLVWPSVLPAMPNEIPETIRLAAADAKRAHVAGAALGATLAAKTALIRVQHEQGVSSLKQLHENGKISSLLYQQADEIRCWANAFGHEYLEVGAPDSSDVEELLAFLDAVLNAVYVEPEKLRRMREKRNAR